MPVSGAHAVMTHLFWSSLKTTTESNKCVDVQEWQTLSGDCDSDMRVVVLETLAAPNVLNWENAFDLFANNAVMHSMTEDPVVG